MYYDAFDFSDKTYIFVALDDGTPVGTLRLTEYSDGERLPIFRNFESEIYSSLGFDKRLEEGRKFSESSRFTVLKDYRENMSMVPARLKCKMYEKCIDLGLTDMLIVANPSNVDFYKAAGFKEFARKVDEFSQIDSPAMHAYIHDKFGEIVDRMNGLINMRDMRRVTIDTPEKAIKHPSLI